MGAKSEIANNTYYTLECFTVQASKHHKIAAWAFHNCCNAS